MLEIGSLVDGKYKILNEIGHGGMSVVYLAIVERANQTWAIKEVRKNGATKDDIVQQGLVAEMNILKRLNHAHLPRIIDIIDHEDSFLIVMDYIEGIDLDKKLREGPQKWEDVVEWSKQLCDVFAYLHSRQPPIIYRDMKPGNVKLKPDGNVVLFDFGTAREYKSQKAGDDTTCLGTRGYASPEQYGGMGQTDARSDIYCLGATMYHLITGTIPGGPPDYNIYPIRSICPWLPKTGKAGNCVRGLEKIIMKCLQPNPAYRYQNCAELMYDLEHIDRISDEFVKAQKKKLKTWIACLVCTVVFALSGVVLGAVASRTVSNTYEDTVVSAFKSINSSELKRGNMDYELVESKLKEAIEVNPSNADAWIYLARLYASDSIVENTEKVTMDSILENAKLGGVFEKNESGYSRFCLEWGFNLFFLYGRDASSEVGVSPKMAAPFLRHVIGGSASADNDSKTEANCINNLVNNTASKLTQCPDEFYIEAVPFNIAQQQYNLAKALYPISNHAETIIANKGGFKKEYTVETYINDINEAINCIEQMSEKGMPIPVGIIKMAFYWRSLITLKDIAIDKNAESDDIPKALSAAEKLYNDVLSFNSQNSIAMKYRKNAVDTYENMINTGIGG